MPPRNEEQLTECVRRARNGDDSAWETIDRHLRARIVEKLRFPRHVDPQEVASDAITDVWQALETIRDDQKVVNFALTVARRVAGRKHREAKRHERLVHEPSTPNGDDVGERNLAGEELLDRISSPLEGLDQKLFRLLYVVGADKNELKTELGLEGSNLRKRKHRLNKKLRKGNDIDGDSHLS